MPSPFIGMDPYLERFWNDVHGPLVTYIKDALNESMPAQFRATMQERVFIADWSEPQPTERYPDVAIMESPFVTGAGEAAHSQHALMQLPDVLTYDSDPVTEYSVEIVDSKSGEKVITAIEVLSPANKRAGDGMKEFQRKQEEYRRAGVSRVEIDLLREGRRLFDFPADILKPRQKKPYYVTVYRAHRAGECELYAIDLRDPLPLLKIPLRDDDADVSLDLQALLNHVYRTGRFPIDYRKQPDPPLTGDDAAIAENILRNP